MDSVLDVMHRFWSDLAGRIHGPETVRFFLQPVMATVLAFRDGIRDARTGRDPYLWHLLRTDSDSRRHGWREGVTAVRRVLILGVAMDVVYQVRVFGGFPYPGETFVVCVLLAFVPYLFARGPAARLAKWWMQRHPGAKSP